MTGIALELDQLLADANALHSALATMHLDRLLFEANEQYRRVAERQGCKRDPQAAEFNIFRLTERANFEVTTHQKMLADLLNPLGTHGQGDFFLRPFLNLVAVRTGIALRPPNGLWEVDNGRDNIDVRLRHPDSGDGDRVIIETKWDAPEQKEGQVIRYWREEMQRANQETRKKERRIPVVFLTRDGRQPIVQPNEPYLARFRNDLVVLSYGEIAPLLNDAIRNRSVKAPRVVETLRQYVELLENLAPSTEDNES